MQLHECFDDSVTSAFKVVTDTGYPFIYYDERDRPLCPVCADYNYRAIDALRISYERAYDECETTPGMNRTRQINTEKTYYAIKDRAPVRGEVYYVGPTVACAKCGKDIRSAYGVLETEEIWDA